MTRFALSFVAVMLSCSGSVANELACLRRKEGDAEAIAHSLFGSRPRRRGQEVPSEEPAETPAASARGTPVS